MTVQIPSSLNFETIPRLPFLKDQPSEWPVLTPEEREILRPRAGIYTMPQVALMERIARTRWFLLRNDGPQGERWRCGRCHAIHSHFTMHCVPAPMHGLTQAVGLLVERVGKDDVFACLELGAIDPISATYAKTLYAQLRGLGYPAQVILGYDSREEQRARWASLG